ncbi:AzlD family protein [Salinarimonas soli]|uniref:AzlD domain-containing protein n=1 Tax=Salinarimonas soli TaxID=1638099 RepID=A0A5B2VAV8_9HYPH|nr:AzlD domain-containing protein [Salinarimonas soli]KAA2235522.1 AzlD domain-containing protein [Salinarimonas soli]
MVELSGPAWSAVAIGLMALVTYLCRIGGILLMSRVSVTPRIARALRALPGCIVAATILPVALASGLAASLALAAAVAVMAIVRHELAALAAGLGTVALARAVGL